MDKYTTVKMPIKDLFNIISKSTNHVFKDDEWLDLKDVIKIQNENNEWINIKSLVQKTKNIVKIKFTNGIEKTISEKHLFGIYNSDGEWCFQFAGRLKPGNKIQIANNIALEVASVESQKMPQKVYDCEVDSETHLYQTSDGIINHNSAKGKSLLADVWLGENIKAGGIGFKIDVEDAAGFKFTAKVVGSEDVAKQIRLISPKTLGMGKEKFDASKLVITIERLTNILNKIIDYQLSKGDGRNKSVLIVIDSVSQLSSDKEINDIRDEKDKRDMTAQQKMRALFRAITQMLRYANVTIVGIAHLTANIGVMFGEKSVINAKGSAFGYASSLTLQAMSSKELLDPKSGVPIGIKMKFKTKKNRMAYKGRDCFVYLYFDGGIDPYGGLVELMVQYGIAKASAKAALDGGYKDSVVFTYITDSGTELKFKANDTKKIIDANGGMDLLKEIETKLNDSFHNKLKEQGVTEIDLLAYDEMEEEVDFGDEEVNMEAE